MQTFVDAVASIYNPAQIDVLTRASLLARRQLGLDAAAEEDQGRE
ncbi:hypothetical protein O7626_30780 [Micromonospora sp. WMMD1102]|nr:hypothetical protein [Micromonospora sp. WMMD1102]MDG4790256.1 hypothetical protein [Micromonospora sp. WMMD1102]